MGNRWYTFEYYFLELPEFLHGDLVKAVKWLCDKSAIELWLIMRKCSLEKHI